MKTPNLCTHPKVDSLSKLPLKKRKIVRKYFSALLPLLAKIGGRTTYSHQNSSAERCFQLPLLSYFAEFSVTWQQCPPCTLNCIKTFSSSRALLNSLHNLKCQTHKHPALYQSPTHRFFFYVFQCLIKTICMNSEHPSPGILCYE